MKSRLLNGAATFVNGRGTAHLKASKEEKAWAIIDIIDRRIPYYPSQIQLCRDFGISQGLVWKMRQLYGRTNDAAVEGNGDAMADTSADTVVEAEIMPMAATMAEATEVALFKPTLQERFESIVTELGGIAGALDALAMLERNGNGSRI